MLQLIRDWPVHVLIISDTGCIQGDGILQTTLCICPCAYDHAKLICGLLSKAFYLQL